MVQVPAAVERQRALGELTPRGRWSRATPFRSRKGVARTESTTAFGGLFQGAVDSRYDGAQ